MNHLVPYEDKERIKVIRVMTVSKSNGQFAWINIMKGILIFLMVLSHTHVYLREYIFLFHMPVFFMISGYCWNKRHSSNLENLMSYIRSKTVRLYIPFLFLNLSYVLLFNYMLKIGIFTSDERFLSLVINPPEKQNIYHPYSIREITTYALRSLVFAGGGNPLSNPTWFLGSLWVAVVAHSVLELLIEKMRLTGNRNIILCVLFVVSVCAAYLFDVKAVKIVGPIDRAPCTYACYLAGILIKEFQPIIKNRVIACETDISIRVLRIIVSALILYGLFVRGFRIRLSSCVISNPVIMILCLILGWYLIMDISKIICKNKTLEYLGKNTMPILLLHLTVFKLVSYLYLVITNNDLLLLASFPVVYLTPEWFRFIYAIAGTVIPILLYIPYKRAKTHFQIMLKKG